MASSLVLVYENKAFENETTDGALLSSKFSEYDGNFISSISLSLEEKSKKITEKSKTLDPSTIFSDNAMNPTTPELSKSQYSLVSTGELTAEALQVWLKLPKRIKYDPELEQFQKRYESDIANQQEEIPLKTKNGSAPESKRLPSVKSAPHLHHNRVLEECASKIDGVSFLVPDEESQRHPPYFFQDADEMNFGKTGRTDNIEENVASNDDKSGKGSKMALFRHYLKMTLLLVCWLFFTLVFMLYNEKEVVTRLSSVNPGEIKSYMLNISDDQLTILAKISGPFMTEQGEKKVNETQLENAPKILVWLEYWTSNTSEEVNTSSTQISQTQSLLLQDDLDFNTGEPRSVTLSLRPVTNHSGSYVLRMRSTADQAAPLTLSYSADPIDPTTGVIYSCVLLCGLYVLIIFEIINRTMAAVIVSTTSLAVLALVGERPTLPELVSWLDVETLLLLFSMMILVAIMAETGMFDYLAVFTFEVTKGKLWPLITLLCAITALLSTFLDNVTTVLLMTPVTIRLCEVMDLNPIPILMSMVLFSNIGGTATPVGDPPNVIIASNRIVVQSGINFTSFTLHMSVGIVAVCVQTYFQLRYMYRDTASLRLNEPREIQDLRQQISVWRRAIDSLPHLSRDQQVVRRRLERKMTKLTAQLAASLKESQRRVCPKDTYRTTLEQLKEKYQIRDKRLLVKAVFAISFVVAVFFLHSIPELNRVSLGWTALLGAVLLLILADRADLEPILHHVEWSTLLFFAALFVLMEALSKLGLIAFIGGLTESLILRVDEGGRLAVALVLLLWVSGISSAFVDNIPLTTMMVRVVTALAANPALGLPITPLVWALSFGACLGGNGTLIGASANVVCAGVAEQHGYRISFVQFFKIGFPVMIGHLVVATGYLLLCHCVFTWH